LSFRTPQISYLFAGLETGHGQMGTPNADVADSRLFLRKSKATGKAALSPRQAIRAKCLNCAEDVGTVRHCPCSAESQTPCPLHPLRYGPKKREQKMSALKAIRAYCLWCVAEQPSLVRECEEDDCPLHPYRFGHRRGVWEGRKARRGGNTDAAESDE